MSVRFDLPTMDDDSRTFWEAARDGRFLIKRCRGCGEAHYYPRPFCPHCWSDEVGWEEASGRATLYTWSVVHRNDLAPFAERLPYVAAVVDLVEGPRAITNVVGCEPGSLAAGMALKVGFEDVGEGVTIPVFGPA